MDASRPADLPRVAAIVPVRNGSQTIARCVQALLDQDYAGSLEIIVVDNNSTDATVDTVARYAAVRLLEERRVGSYAARNRAVAASDADVLIFTDADCEPRTSWVSAAVTGLGPNGFAVGPVEMFSAEEQPSAWTLWEMVHAFPQESYFRQHGFGVTANLTVSRAAFDEAGLFDPSLLSGGDKEWCRRASSKGVRGTYCAAAAVRHPARSSLSEVRAKVRRVAGGTAEVRLQAAQRPLQPRDLMPPFRSIRTGLQSAKLTGRRDQAQYLYAVAGHYLLRVYYAIAAARATRRRSRRHTKGSVTEGSP